MSGGRIYCLHVDRTKSVSTAFNNRVHDKHTRLCPHERTDTGPNEKVASDNGLFPYKFEHSYWRLIRSVVVAPEPTRNENKNHYQVPTTQKHDDNNVLTAHGIVLNFFFTLL